MAFSGWLCRATIWYHIYGALPATDPSHFQQSLEKTSEKAQNITLKYQMLKHHFTPRILTISTSRRKCHDASWTSYHVTKVNHQRWPHVKFSHCVGLCLAFSPTIFTFLAHLQAEFTSWKIFHACNLKGCRPKSPAVSTTPGADNVTAGSSSSEANWREREPEATVRQSKIMH